MPRDRSKAKPQPKRRPAPSAAPPSAATRPLAAIGAAAVGVIAAVVAGAWWWFRPPTFALPPPNPDMNVVLVTIDTLRADMLSCYGGPVPTPNLDALAAHGARFTFAHAHAVVTLVSHTTILTGLLPYQHGVRDNSGFRVPDGTVTAGTRFKAAGFSTGAFIGGYPLTKRFGLTPGFDDYDDQLPEERGLVTFSMPERRADVVVSHAVDWIGRQNGKFFGWVHVFDPHAPYTPPPEFLARFPDHPYYGEIAFADHALGALFDKLATLPRPTLVIATADHGESLGDHGELTHGMFAYESTLHVPLIVAMIAPGSLTGPTARATTVDAPVTHLDLLPTMLDAVGLPSDPSLKGESLREVIRTDREKARPSYFEAMTFNLTRGWAPLRGVLVSRSKYIDLPIPELYDLRPDPAEQSNLAPTEPDRLPPLRDALRGFNVAVPNQPQAETAEVVAALRSLGYGSSRAAPKGSYTAADDPKTLVTIDHEVHVAQDLYEHGQPGEAIDRLSRVVGAHPALADACLYLAYAQWETGDEPDAIKTLETAIANHVTDANVPIRLGIYLAESGTDPGRAIRLLEHLPPTDIDVLNGLGVAYVDAGRLDDALATFRRILKLDSTNGFALENIASVQLREAESLGPNDPRRAARLEEAEKTVGDALEVDPALADAYNTRGVILETMGQKTMAIESWKQAVQLDNRQFDAMYNLVLKLSEAGRTDEARTYAKAYVATAPSGRYAKEITEMRRFLGG
jgi:arylsulfatase A-like enzyme/Flp pilus assembly protein TadD